VTRASKTTFYILLIWFVSNLRFLGTFPFVHSDEIWLGGLTREMMRTGSIAATEPFFDLLPRNPHALKILFHAGQAVFLNLFGFGVVGIRMLSLASGTFGLWLFFKVLRATGIGSRAALAGMLMLAFDAQYLYASHFGRQEILVAVFMFAGLLLFFRESLRPPFRALCVGLCVGLALGVHPNAVVAAVPVTVLYAGAILLRRRKLREGFVFAGTAALSSLVFILASFLMNRHFLSDYSEFGGTVGVRSGLTARIADFPAFFAKLFFRISGTYYTPEIRPQLLLVCALLCLAAVTFAWSLMKGRNFFDHWTVTEKTGMAGIAGIGAGIFLLGKFAQPSIVLMIPFLYLCVASLLSRFADRARPLRTRILAWGLCALLPLYSLSGVIADIRSETESYADLCENISALVPPGTRSLANLSWGIPLHTDNMRDIRNLAFLESAGLSVPDYVEKNKITVIIVSDELDFIYASRPVWNVMYGNPARWYPELRDFIADRCVPAGEFSSPGYGMRIVSRRYSRDWKVRVYRVSGAESEP